LHVMAKMCNVYGIWYALVHLCAIYARGISCCLVAYSKLYLPVYLYASLPTLYAFFYTSTSRIHSNYVFLYLQYTDLYQPHTTTPSRFTLTRTISTTLCLRCDYNVVTLFSFRGGLHICTSSSLGSPSSR
jgi:hypothetical protein